MGDTEALHTASAVNDVWLWMLMCVYTLTVLYTDSR